MTCQIRSQRHLSVPRSYQETMARIKEVSNEASAASMDLRRAMQEGRRDDVRIWDSQIKDLVKLELQLYEDLRTKRAPTTSSVFSLLQCFFHQPSPTSSKKKDPATASSPSASAERYHAPSDADGQQQLDLSLPSESGLRKRLLKSPEVLE
ncbi:hypothetical protein BJ741DRAFT_592319 [Chytriomyces cf. hyalinus JEL632]|nr:hypothetical protein BJ741DRAFT_592319 [Chytriomyces cf. hyalinus JEL632]